MMCSKCEHLDLVRLLSMDGTTLTPNSNFLHKKLSRKPSNDQSIQFIRKNLGTPNKIVMYFELC